MQEVKFCPNCGKQVRSAINCCTSCGYDLTRIMDASNSVPANNNPPQQLRSLNERDKHPLMCPVCLQVDQVAKVSAIVASGTVESTSRGTTWGVGTVSGSDTRIHYQSDTKHSTQTQTVLSQKLNFWSKISQLESIEFAVSAVWLIVVFLIGPSMQAIWFSVTILVIGIIYSFAAYSPMKKRVRMETEAARLRWEKLDYCARDDVTFDPAAGVPVRPEQIRDYLYR